MLRHLLRSAAPLLAASLLALGLGACSEGEGPSGPSAGPSAPALPPVTTMQANLTLLGQGPLAGVSSAQASDVSRLLATQPEFENFLQAALRVTYVELVLYLSLREPVAAFALAIHSVPQLQDDGSWLWTYIFVDDGVEYSVFLRARDLGTEISWRMEVSSNDPSWPLDHFLWFDGRSGKDVGAGYWQFYTTTTTTPTGMPMAAGVSAGTPGIPCARIDWVNGGEDDFYLSVLNNKAGDADEGDRLDIQGTPLFSTLDFFDASLAVTDNITWYADGSGSITAHDYNGGLEACWDADQKNSVCAR